jgi:hypothetical protein
MKEANREAGGGHGRQRIEKQEWKKPAVKGSESFYSLIASSGLFDIVNAGMPVGS